VGAFQRYAAVSRNPRSCYARIRLEYPNLFPFGNRFFQRFLGLVIGVYVHYILLSLGKTLPYSTRLPESPTGPDGTGLQAGCCLLLVSKLYLGLFNSRNVCGKHCTKGAAFREHIQFMAHSFTLPLAFSYHYGYLGKRDRTL